MNGKQHTLIRFTTWPTYEQSSYHPGRSVTVLFGWYYITYLVEKATKALTTALNRELNTQEGVEPLIYFYFWSLEETCMVFVPYCFPCKAWVVLKNQMACISWLKTYIFNPWGDCLIHCVKQPPRSIYLWRKSVGISEYNYTRIDIKKEFPEHRVPTL